VRGYVRQGPLRGAANAVSPADHAALAVTQCAPGPGAIVRSARTFQGLTLAELGKRVGYSAAQVSRYERGIAPLTDVTVLRRFAAALAIPPQIFGLAPERAPAQPRHARAITVPAAPSPRSSSTVAVEPGCEDGEDPMRRRQLLANLAVTAAGASVHGVTAAPPAEGPTGELLITRVRDAMLALAPSPAEVNVSQLRTGLADALNDFHSCRYRQLATGLPRLISGGHALTARAVDDPDATALLAEIYTMATRLLIKLDDQQLGWMAADRAQSLATAGGDPLAAAEASRNLAVLARKAGWHVQATSIALTAAGNPALRGDDPRLWAERGLLLQSAAYTAARSGDRDGMRELTAQAAAIAARARDPVLIRDHGGGFTPATVQLHRISAEYSIGEPGAAIAAARALPPASLPTTERRARYWTDVARAYGQWGRREDCVRALLTAERQAPEETHARPAIRDLVTGLLLSGRTSPELRGLALRCGIT
jgi:transcriptional regulator with XRE-family HTH domain